MRAYLHLHVDTEEEEEVTTKYVRIPRGWHLGRARRRHVVNVAGLISVHVDALALVGGVCIQGGGLRVTEGGLGVDGGGRPASGFTGFAGFAGFAGLAGLVSLVTISRSGGLLGEGLLSDRRLDGRW